MYYKIENKDSKIYKKLHELRLNEIRIEKDNLAKVKERIGHSFSNFLGHHGQQNLHRTTQYIGFVFDNPEELDSKVWKKHKDVDDVYVPNRRSKLGKEIEEFLRNGLEGSMYVTVFEILEVEDIYGSFMFPFVEIVEDNIYILLDSKQEPKSEDVIEITKREFNNTLKID